MFRGHGGALPDMHGAQGRASAHSAPFRRARLRFPAALSGALCGRAPYAWTWASTSPRASTPTPSAATTSAAGVKLPRQVHSSEWSVRGEQLLAVARVTARRSGRRRRRRGHLERGSIDRIADALSGPDADEHPMLGWSWRQDSSVRPPACRATCIMPATVRALASGCRNVLPEDGVDPAPPDLLRLAQPSPERP